LLIGPGSILDAHTDDEKVAVADLESAVQIYVETMKSLIERGRSHE
jgi:acetylornithine deacetylase/succinyl-diaminopimelate desuccinylase-like protein